MNNYKLLPGLIHRMRINANGFVRRFFWLLLLVAIAGLADMLTTIHVMLRDGARAEAHPAIRFVATLFGPVAGPILGKTCQLACVVLVAIYLRPWAVYLLVLVAFLYGWAAWYNLWGYRIYTPALLKYLPL